MERRLAELMVPIGRLYRHGAHVMIYGQSLVNKSPSISCMLTDLLVDRQMSRELETTLLES